MCSFCQQTNKKEAVKMFFFVSQIFFSSVLKLVKLQQQITVKTETEQTNKQTRKKIQKNSTMIDDRRLLKPANENKTKKH